VFHWHGTTDSGLTVWPLLLLLLLLSGARAPLYRMLAPEARGRTFYHNTLGIPPSIPAAAAAAGARTPLYCALAPEVRGSTFYHNTLGIIPSSNAS
jgi:hypothetical protein